MGAGAGAGVQPALRVRRVYFANGQVFEQVDGVGVPVAQSGVVARRQVALLPGQVVLPPGRVVIRDGWP